MFDNATNEQDMRDAHSRAARTASWLGLPTSGPDSVTDGFVPRWHEGWRICHPGCELFGDEVPDDVVTNPSAGVDKGAMGLALIEGFW